MRSMTGFGRAQGADPAKGIGFSVEISSINRKQFELKLSLPHDVAFMETELRRIIGEKVSRGSVLVRVASLEGLAPKANCTVNSELAKKLALAARQLADECGLTEQKINMADILALPGVVQADPAAFDEESTASLLAKITEEAVCNLVRSRETEGDELAKDISLRLSILKETLEKIIPLASALPQKQYEKLLGRLKELDLPANAAVAADDDRLLRELVLYADKLDVTEEITRLHSHFLNWDKALTSGRQEAVGRQLDFMVQETFREINTLGNKAACAEISPLIVIMKTELEKIREQVQNIE
ncbi:MAG: YicC family protein [Lentisphaeria bacterium]|nr:YicC family protein [Lentisphaeria bacterium]